MASDEQDRSFQVHRVILIRKKKVNDSSGLVPGLSMVNNSVSHMLPRPTKLLTTDARNVSTGDPLTYAKV